MLISALLDRMVIGDNELRTSRNERDEARAITALNMVQDWIDAVVAGEPELLQTYSTITTTANTEATSWPSGLLRLDSLWYVDTTSTPNLPTFEVDLIWETGGHRPALAWPYSAVILPGTGTGVPREAYVTKKKGFHWSPVPNDTYTYRYYGYVAATDITARSETYGFDDDLSVPHALYAAKLLRLGQDDEISALQSEASDAFRASLRKERKFRRVGPRPRTYTEIHTT